MVMTRSVNANSFSRGSTFSFGFTNDLVTAFLACLEVLLFFVSLMEVNELEILILLHRAFLLPCMLKLVV